MSADRAEKIAKVTYQSPGSLYPEVRTNYTMDHTVSRPFPQAIVYPNASRLTVPSVFQHIDDSRGVTNLRYTKPTNGLNMIPALKEPAEFKDSPAENNTKKDGLGTPAKVLIGIALIVGVILLVEYNR